MNSLDWLDKVGIVVLGLVMTCYMVFVMAEDLILIYGWF